MELLQLGAPARGLAGSLNKVEAAPHACKPHCLLLQEVFWLTEAGESFPSSELALVPVLPLSDFSAWHHKAHGPDCTSYQTVSPSPSTPPTHTHTHIL